MPDHEFPPSELDDYPRPLRVHLPRVDMRRLVQPATVRGLVAVMAGLILIVWGLERNHIADVIGVSLIVVALVDVTGSRLAGTGWLARLGAGIAFAVGVTLVIWPSITGAVLGLALAGFLLISGVADLVGFARMRARAGVWPLLRVIFKIVLGVVILIAGEEVISAALLLVALSWIAAGAFTLVTNLRADTEEEARVSDSWERFLTWLDLREYSRDARFELYEKLFYEGPDTRRRVTRFFTLMGFATAIATYGVVQDSTAVVIGAMLIAPLMTPLMGTAASLIMGWPRRAERSALVALSGIAFAVVLAFVLAATVPALINVTTNTQIAARVNPNLVDLLIALAAGGAGAFALSRPDVSDALPGVAIAISLVPPLSVVGITLQQRAFDDALGAWLLFTTNMVAILVAGGIVFLLTGFTPLRRVREQRDWIGRTFATVGLLALVVFAILAASSQQLSLSFTAQASITATVQDWGDEQDGITVLQVHVSGSTVEVAVAGETQPTDIDQLAADLAAQTAREVEVVVRWFPEQTFTEQAAPS